MAIMVLDPYVEAHILSERKGCDGNQYDEVWEGIYIVTPLPNDEHQGVSARLDPLPNHRRREVGQCSPWREYQRSRRGLGKTIANPTAVFLTTAAQPRHALARAADFLVEIISPGSRTRENPSTAARVVELDCRSRPVDARLSPPGYQLTKIVNPAASDVLSSQTVI